MFLPVTPRPTTNIRTKAIGQLAVSANSPVAEAPMMPKTASTVVRPETCWRQESSTPAASAPAPMAEISAAKPPGPLSNRPSAKAGRRSARGLTADAGSRKAQHLACGEETEIPAAEGSEGSVAEIDFHVQRAVCAYAVHRSRRRAVGKLQPGKFSDRIR